MSLKTSERHRELQRTGRVATAKGHASQLSRRRSTRMSLSAPVGLSGQDRQKGSFTIDARATNLNKHGAAVQLGRELMVGSVITLQNKQGAQVSARVVARLAAVQGVSTYGVEFVEQNDGANGFWGISFPTNAS